MSVLLTSIEKVVLKKILTPDNTDYCLEINSEMKAVKERGMQSQFETRFEAELENIKTSIHKKGGVKLADKVNQRIGRAKQKYPPAQGRYDIELNYDKDRKTVVAMTWSLNGQKEKQANDNLGTYFIRTSMDMKDEIIVWDVYNTIRCQLKSHGINYCRTEIVRIDNTQKIITTTGYNKAGNEIKVRKCSEPEQKLKSLHQALGIKNRPFTKLKSVVHKPKPKIPQLAITGKLSSA